MIRVFEMDRPRWSTGSATFLIEGLEGLEPDPAGARRLRGCLDLRFDEVQEENAFENPSIRAYLRDLYDRAPWAAYYIVPTQDQLTMFLVAHGAWFEAQEGGSQLMAGEEIITALENVLLAAAIYAVERGDDWRQVVEPWASTVSPDLTDDVRGVLSETYDRHRGLRLTASGWVACD